MADEQNLRPSASIEARVLVRTLGEMGWKNFVGLRDGSRLSFFVNGIYYDCVVEKVDSVIKPGGDGIIRFTMASDSILETTLKNGSRVELRAGATIVGIAEILSVKKVWTKRSPLSERGYVVVDNGPTGSSGGR